MWGARVQEGLVGAEPNEGPAGGRPRQERIGKNLLLARAAARLGARARRPHRHWFYIIPARVKKFCLAIFTSVLSILHCLSICNCFCLKFQNLSKKSK